MSETNDLVGTLKHLRKGAGLTLGSLAAVPDLEQVFGTKDLVSIRQAIVNAVRSESDDPCVAALANAYALDRPPGSNLMERRAAYIEQHKMAMRTLTNYEEFGVIVLAQLVHLPVTSTSNEVDLLLSVVEEISNLGLLRGFQPQELTSVLEKLNGLQDASDTQIDETHAVRLQRLIDQFRTAFRLNYPTSAIGMSSHDPIGPAWHEQPQDDLHTR
jgi:hypothetical protein